MDKNEALKLLDAAPCDNKMCRINKGMTTAQAVDIVRRGINSLPDGEQLSSIFVKRVYQICQNRVRPNIPAGDHP